MQIFNFFPSHIINILKKYSINLNESLEEIRFRAGQPIILKFSNIDAVVDYKVTSNDLLEILEKLCENSIYSYLNRKRCYAR